MSGFLEYEWRLECNVFVAELFGDMVYLTKLF